MKLKQKHNYKRILWIAFPIVLIAAGLYLLVLLLAPMSYSVPSPQTWNVPVPKIEIRDQRVYIPRLSLNLLYKGDEAALAGGLWHRSAERGNPKKGGNFILAGHRFEIGLTPGETRRKSPLYHIDKIQVGDYIYSDFNGKRYKYEVSRKYEVKPAQVEIEAPSKTAKMTLYTCTLRGEADGREVIEAKLVEKNIHPANELKVNR